MKLIILKFHNFFYTCLTIKKTLNKTKILNKSVCRALFVNDSTYRPKSDFNKEVSYFQLEWSQLRYPSDDMNDEDLNEILMQIDMPEAHGNLVLDSEHSIVSLPMSSSQTEVLLPVTTQSLFDTQTDTAIFSSISNFQDETPCPPSDENEVLPEFDESLIDMSEHDIQQFIDGQQSKNTIKKTLRDVDFVEKSFPFEK